MDFFSLGTNDLTEYTLAMDRTNRRIAGYYNPKHPALIKMIRIVANNVHLEGKRISICGDLAADLSMTEQFINMGIDELSILRFLHFVNIIRGQIVLINSNKDN